MNITNIFKHLTTNRIELTFSEKIVRNILVMLMATIGLLVLIAFCSLPFLGIIWTVQYFVADRLTQTLLTLACSFLLLIIIMAVWDAIEDS